ncbi:MAG TPA: alpha-glucan family phosphorylase [Myxococcaceae bacterium]|nr:alpha-glucan family phosphorylase [Myxococcaceae bacterium]
MASLSPCTTHAEEPLRARLPQPLQPLVTLATNLWWSWHPEVAALFEAVDPERWESSGHNPVKLVRDASPHRLEQVARDAALVERARALVQALEAELERPFETSGPATRERPIAFLCAEYGLHASLPIYSGGLGVLAGDVLKQASDSGLPLVGVGLYYRRGFFHQRLDRSGWQHEWWSTSDPEDLPLRLEVDDRGDPRTVELVLRGHPVRAQIWHVQVGRIPLFLLDTDVPENAPIDRWITSTLYVADRTFRVMQYAVLAMGGLRALRALGMEPSVVHLNEGHAALAALELARESVRSGVPFDRALADARQRVVFTTHTPIPAGNEHYGQEEILDLLGHVPGELGVAPDTLLALARPPDEASFGVTELALRTSRTANAVSARHGEVARAMWQKLWPGKAETEVPILDVTNGVHAPSWIAPPLQALLDRYLPPSWRMGDPRAWAAVEGIPAAELWAARNALRSRLVEFVRHKTVQDRLARGEDIPYVEAAARHFDPAVLTLGFARRVASYKRLDLLICDPPRALALLHGPRRLQLVISGKAHPSDDGAKRLVQRIFELKDAAGATGSVAFLEDYDLRTAEQLVAGCDVWLNLPRPPNEASGTSGMKAALNGGLNLSVLDGWWPEAYDRFNGWAIPDDDAQDEEARDVRDASTLYDLLEREVVPTFHERDAAGIPVGWVRRMKDSLRIAGARFTTARMMSEYVQRVYRSGA